MIFCCVLYTANNRGEFSEGLCGKKMVFFLGSCVDAAMILTCNQLRRSSQSSLHPRYQTQKFPFLLLFVAFSSVPRCRVGDARDPRRVCLSVTSLRHTRPIGPGLCIWPRNGVCRRFALIIVLCFFGCVILFPLCFSKSHITCISSHCVNVWELRAS